MIDIKPWDIDIGEHLWGAFYNYETEVSARYIVGLCQASLDWLPFSYEEINGFYHLNRNNNHDHFSFHNLLRTSDSEKSMFQDQFPKEGWITVDQDKLYHVTDDFILRCYRSSLNAKDNAPIRLFK
jgi:hypothetical protein